MVRHRRTGTPRGGNRITLFAEIRADPGQTVANLFTQIARSKTREGLSTTYRMEYSALRSI